MRIAISMRIVDASGYAEPRDAIAHDWIYWFDKQGHDAFFIPNADKAPERYLDLVGAQAVIFSGGNDLVPASCGSKVSHLRNQAENRVLRAAISKKLPVLGVCRGLHLINQYFGGQTRDMISGTANHVACDHDVTLEGPMAALASSSTIRTNSYHNQGVGADDLATDLTAFAWCEADGNVEGLYHPQMPVLAVQWHPERNSPSTHFDDAAISQLFCYGAFWAT